MVQWKNVSVFKRVLYRTCSWSDGKMAQWLRGYPALAGGLSSVSGTGSSLLFITPAPGNLLTFADIYAHTNIL